MLSPFRFTTIAHANRRFLGPYDAFSLESLSLPATERVLDIGCGKGAALQALGGIGIGIEHNPAFAAEARRLNPNAEIWEEDARTCLGRLPAPPDLILCLGASQAIGSREEALSRLGDLLAPGGSLLFGDGYWRRKPDSEYLAFLGAEESEMGFFDRFDWPGLVRIAARESTYEEWDAYEESYFQGVIDWCDAHPDDPDSEAYRKRITDWRAAYLRWGRDTLGFGIYLFRKD